MKTKPIHTPGFSGFPASFLDVKSRETASGERTCSEWNHGISCRDPGARESPWNRSRLPDHLETAKHRPTEAGCPNAAWACSEWNYDNGCTNLIAREALWLPAPQPGRRKAVDIRLMLRGFSDRKLSFAR